MTGSCAHLCFASWMLCGVLTRLIDLPRVITLSWEALIAGSGILTVKLFDTFTRSWSGEVNWWVPPQSLVCRMCLHAEPGGTRGTLVVTAWKSAPHWLLICPDGCHLAPYMFSVGVLSPAITFGCSGSNIASVMQPVLYLHVLFC